MAPLEETFIAWVLAQRPAGYTPEQIDHNHIVIHTATATAEVNLYPFGDEQEVVEYRIVRTGSNDPSFFLHVTLDDLSRAKDLFSQMSDALEDETTRETTRVLLTCTSALTTSLFAQKMNDVAKALNLDYDFCALSVDRAIATTEPYAAILLAPQVSHLRKQLVEAHPNARVFEIPAKTFGSYDAASAVRLLMHALRDMKDTNDDNGLRAVRTMHDNKHVLVITLLSLRDHARLGYKLFDNGKVSNEGSVRKPRLDYRDISDLIQALPIDLRTLDAIGIAVPGVTYRGMVSLPGILTEDFDLGLSLSKRFNLPVYVENNCNAAAVGCYVSQDDYENLVFYRHAFGHVAGGMGTMIDGKLLKGHGNLAGEPKYFESRFSYDTENEDVTWSANGMHRLALYTAVTISAIIAPDVLYLAVDTVDDAESFHNELVRILGKHVAPEVRIVHDYEHRVYLGTLALALQKLHDPKYRSLGVTAV